MQTHNDLIGSTEACRILNVDKATLSRWVSAGRITPVTRLAGRHGAMVFHRADIQTFADQRAS